VHGPRTYLGVSIAGFPNLFTVTGPQSPVAFANNPSVIEQHVEWITECINTMRKTGKTIIEATDEAQEQWVGHVNQCINATLIPRTNSWWMGDNISGKPRALLSYLDPEGFGGYRKRFDAVAAKRYEGFSLS
jgi:cyclohexanone monooxygenase